MLDDNSGQTLPADVPPGPPEPKRRKISGAGGPEDPRFVRDCLDHNERGDGILYTAIHRDKHIYNKTTGRWLTFNGHHWDDDIYDQAANSVEDVALRYQQAVDTIEPEYFDALEKLDAANAKVKELNRRAKIVAKGGSAEEQGEIDRAGKAAEGEGEAAKLAAVRLKSERKDYLSRIDRLRSKPGVEKTLFFAHTVTGGLRLRSEDLDQHPMLLPCPNGVLDLETGRLMTGCPDQYLRRAIPIPYQGADCVNPYWRPFLVDIYDGDEEIVDFVRRLLGYCLTGLRREHFIACFVGAGRNGKGTLFEIMHDLLGALCWAIDPEMLMESKAPPHAASHSAHLASLHGRRLAIGAETERNRQISGAAVKRLTGGDVIKARAPNDRDETNFKPTHKLVLHTNDLPIGLTRDFALRERLLKIDHPILYVDEADLLKKQATDPANAHRYKRKDRELPDRLRSNLPGILADLVMACLEWQRDGIMPPQRIKAAAEEVHRSEDHLGRFLDQVVQAEPENRLEFKTFYANFKSWYEETIDDKAKYIPSKKSVGKDMRERGYQMPDPKETGGKQFVYDIRIPIL